jgi:hypothetical protein
MRWIKPLNKEDSFLTGFARYVILVGITRSPKP